MPKLDFAEAVDLVLAQDTRYGREAYYFLREALQNAVKREKKGRESTGDSHVSGQQLLDGIRQHALKQYGPMVVTVFEYWGIRNCGDFGEMVFNLIRAGAFRKTENDSIEDFKGGYTFQEAFVDPYLPEKRMPVRRVRAVRPAKELN
jgi:uncharacterized repeat protein (TIGR04138 family)